MLANPAKAHRAALTFFAVCIAQRFRTIQIEKALDGG